MQKPSLTIVRRIKASPQRCYEAFTRPELVSQWWGPDAGPVLLAEMDVRVGGRFRIGFQMLTGERHEMTGAYHVVEPSRRLVWETTWVAFPERPSIVTVDFRAIDEGTELTVHHEQFHDEEVRDSHLQGWNGTLDKLKSLLEATVQQAPKSIA